MTVLAETPQLYDPGPDPYAWFTMELLLVWLGVLALGVAAAIGMALALTYRATRNEKRAHEQDRRLDTVAGDLGQLTDWANDLEADIDTETTNLDPQPATTPQDAAIDHWHTHLTGTTPRPTPRPRATAGRHAHPEDQ